MTASKDFIKVHDAIEDHPKVAPLSDAAFRQLVTAWGWCHRHDTDGRMPAALWLRRGTKKVREELAAAGLVVGVNGSEVEFHDYLEWQQSAEKRKAGREQRRAAGQAGGKARAKRVASEPSSESLSENQAEVRGKREEQQTSSVGARKRATRVPDIFPITDDLAAWGREHCPLVTDPQAETRLFLDHHRAKGSTMVDWTAAWRTWMGKAQKYAAERRRPAAPADRVMTVEQLRGRRL